MIKLYSVKHNYFASIPTKYLVAIEAKYLCFISDIYQQDALANY
jgi:hypothetical protein